MIRENDQGDIIYRSAPSCILDSKEAKRLSKNLFLRKYIINEYITKHANLNQLFLSFIAASI